MEIHLTLALMEEHRLAAGEPPDEKVIGPWKEDEERL